MLFLARGCVTRGYICLWAWCCVKDSGEEHSKFVHHNVSAHDMNEGKMEYAKFNKVGIELSCEFFSFQCVPKGSPTCTFLDEETSGCYSSRRTLSHVQECPIQHGLFR